MLSNLGLKKFQDLLHIAIIFAIVALLASIAKNIVTERWLNQKKQVACIPANTDNSHPIVYHQTAINPVQNDALVKTFVEEYVHLILNESLVDYHKVTEDSRYDNARLSASKHKAIEMAIGPEKALNMEKYAKSNELYYELQKGNIGWEFLIDDILIYPGQNNGATIAVIRGEYQVIYDKVKVDLPPRLWGYREVVLVLQQGMPTEDEEGLDVNKNGLYVSFSTVNVLTPDQKKSADKKAYGFYLQRENL